MCARLMKCMYRIWLALGSPSDAVIRRTLLIEDEEASSCFVRGHNCYISRLQSRGWLRIIARCTYQLTELGKVEGGKLQ